jgi:hypothetical protein
MTIIDRVEAWQCKLCDALHDYEDDAGSCCQAVCRVSVVKCPVCGDLCDSVDDICCTPERLEAKLSMYMRIGSPSAVKQTRRLMEKAETIDWENLT